MLILTEQLPMDQGLTGLQCALIALSYFRHRHDNRPRFKKGRGHHATQMVGQYPEYVSVCRRYVRLARKSGWRGSIRQALVTTAL